MEPKAADNESKSTNKAETEPAEYSVSSADADKGTSRVHRGDRYVHIKVPRMPQVKRPAWFSRFAVLLVIAGFIVSAGFGFLGGWLANQNDDTGVLSGSLANQKQVVTSQSQLINSIAKTVGPSVVSVDVVSQQSSTNFFGFAQPQAQEDAGTGIILSSDGLIITNRHVVPAGTTSVSVTLSDGTELKNVKVVGRTSDSDSLDIAFLKVTDAQGKKLTPAVLGDASKVQVGDSVVAIGNALGQFQNTVTSGIISGYGRQVQASDSTGTSSENLADLFQTDAAINEGNSGGPLVNMNGQVIGINTAIASGSQNIGFAIPINDVTGLIKQVESTGKLARPFLGVRFIPLTSDVANQYGLSVNRGAYIAPAVDPTQPSVEAGSPAEQAGLKEGDVITQVNGTNIDENHSLTAIIDQHSPGDRLSLTVVRDGKTLNVSVTLGTAPQQ